MAAVGTATATRFSSARPTPTSIPNAALSPETHGLIQRASDLKRPRPPSSLAVQRSDLSLAEAVYEALAQSKIQTSKFAMHLSDDWRRRLFRDLDELHEVAEWEPGDKPVKEGSFLTFLRTMLLLKPERRPGLGLSSVGNLIAAWTEADERLTMEFLPNDQVRWVLSCTQDGQRERHAAETSLLRLPAVLAPYSPDRWFLRAGQRPAV
jgi:hypothetical protein